MKKPFNEKGITEYTLKLSLKMKLTLLLTIVSLLQIHANSYSQSKKISLDMGNVTVREVLNEIESVSEFKFLFNRKDVDLDRKVSIKVTKKPITDILMELFAGTDVGFEVLDKQIILSSTSNKTPPIGSVGTINIDKFQKFVVSGKVTDGTGLPLSGANIVEKGTTNGVMADFDGNFSLNVTDGNATLVVSYIGFATKEVSVDGRTTINVTLKESAAALDEIVVVGYGTQRKKDITGSTVSVQMEDLPEVANVSINSLLQGRAAGLNLNQRSAQPGGGLSINIRGGSATPLYVIDGVPLFNNNAPEPSIDDKDLGFFGGVDRDPLSSINPSDIESVDVLKDASAAAIYGSAAANGVILITTKRGSNEKIQTEYRVSHTVQSPKDYFQLLNAKEFMQQQVRLSKDKFLYDNNLAPYGNSSATPVFSPLFTQEQIDVTGAGTDWLGMMMRDGSINEHNISISGGSDKTRVYTSFNSYNNRAVIENSDFRRYTGRVNFEQRLADRIKFSANMTFSQINSKNASTGTIDAGEGAGQEKYNQLQAAYAFAPTVEIFDSAGNYSKSYNRMITNPAAFSAITNNLNTNRFFVAPNLEIEVLKNLKVNLVGGIDKQRSQLKFYLPVSVHNSQLPEGMSQRTDNSIGNYSIEGYATFNKIFGDHSFNIVGGGGYYKSQSESFGLQAVGFFTDAFNADNLGIANNKEKSFANSSKNETTKLSQFLRINYTYLSKYTLSFNGRRDGSSNFAANKKWGIFPGLSAGWQISEEPFLSKSNFISNLKLRVGYGEVGNDANLNALSLYGISGGNFLIGNTLYPSVALTQLGNPDLTWETDKSINIGLDYGLWKNRITGAIDIFRRDANDFIRFVPLPYNNTVLRYQTNFGGETRSEGIEFSIKSINTTGILIWTTLFNISKYSNRWLERSPYDNLNIYQNNDDRLDVVYGWETNGIIKNIQDKPSYMPDAQLGNVIYIDQNGDDELDENDVVKLGYREPQLIYGLGNTFSFKNLDLNIFINGRINQYMSNNYSSFYNPGRIANIDAQNTLVGIKNVWTVDNPTGFLPGIASNPYSGFNPTGTTDFYQEKVSYLKVANVSLGYTINTNEIFQSVRLFLDMQNVATITNYKGYDPELSEANPYPQALSTTLGVTMKF